MSRRIYLSSRPLEFPVVAADCGDEGDDDGEVEWAGDRDRSAAAVMGEVSGGSDANV